MLGIGSMEDFRRGTFLVLKQEVISICCFIIQDVYECMLRNLFEEYRFFPQYPERELYTTAYLFGGIIEKGLAT